MILHKTIDRICTTVTPPAKLLDSNFLSSGEYPVIDQSQTYIAGYTNNIASTLPPDDYILFGDHTCILKFTHKRFAQGADGLKILKCIDSVYPKYVYYAMKSLNFRAERYKRHWSEFKQLSIPVPKLDTQHKIAGVLSALDDKIELNDKINKKLNELARLIYDYWFVQFDFPDEHGRPYRASGGKMVYNDLLKCEIPAGWTVEHLDKILTFQRGTEPGSKAYLSNKTSESCIKFHRVGDMLGNCTTWIDGSIYKLYRVKPSDVLVSFDATIGRISTCIDGAISGGIRHIYDPSERISSAFIWQLFQSQRIQDQMLQFVSGRGSSLAHAGGVIEDLAMAYNAVLIHKYQSIIDPMYRLYVNNQLESQQLAQLRDWLLPMLMSGQVVVK